MAEPNPAPTTAAAATDAATTKTPLEWAEAANERIRGQSAIYDFLLSDIKFASASSGRIVARLTLGKPHVNSRGTMHGAVSATITDWAGGMAISSTGRERSGVSTDIHVSYVGTASVGDELEIEARASKVGGTLAFTSVEIRKVNGGAVVATGSHTKYVKV